MASPLPILLGLGALFLISRGPSSGSAPAPSLSAAYKAGYDDGYKDGVAKKPVKSEAEAKSTPQAVASGDPSEYADGYLIGHADGALSVGKESGGGGGGGGGGSTTYVCKTADAKYSVLDYQKALIVAKSMTPINAKTGKSNADGVCGPITIAAIADFQTKNGLTVTKVIDKATAPMLDNLVEANPGNSLWTLYLKSEILKTAEERSGILGDYFACIVSRPWSAPFDPKTDTTVSAVRLSSGKYKITAVYYANTCGVKVGDYAFKMKSDGAAWVPDLS